MKRPFILLALILSCSTIVPATAQNKNELEKTVNSICKENDMKHATLSVEVYNISKNQVVYSHDAQRSVTPASLNKLFTTAAGFEKLGSNFRFKTTLTYSGNIDNHGVLHGNLYIVGGGDPLLGSYRYKQTVPDTVFSTWEKILRNNGIKSIDGRICFDATIFDNQSLNDSWQWGDIGNYYGSGVSGLNFHENMYFAFFAPGKKIGYPATLERTQPKDINIRSNNEVLTGPENSGDNVIIYGDPENPTRTYRGTVPLGKKSFSVRGALPSPGQTCAELFARYLRNNGINVSSNVTEVFSKRDNTHTLLDYFSNTYYVIAQYTNLTSNNIYAESIFKYLGYHQSGQGSYASGSKAVMSYIGALGLETSGIHIVDGSGLSRLNTVTADFLCRFLAKTAQKSFFKDYNNTLAKVGESGTARNLLPNLPKGIDMRVKSGTMDGVRNYAGYVFTENGDMLCFTVLCSNYDGSSSAIKTRIEKILYSIATLK